MLTQELVNIGLTEKEAEIYVATLQLGYASVFEIAKKTNINRTTTYSHIKNLISRGLVKSMERYGKILFVAERPEKLKSIYEQKEKEIIRKKEMLNDIMPELDSIYNLVKDKPSVKYYNFNNVEELKMLRSEIQNIRTSEMLNIFNYEKYKDAINKHHVQTLLSNVDKFKLIYISKNKIVDSKVRKMAEDEKMFMKYLPVDKFGVLCEILIADDKIVISREHDSLVIVDPLFAQTLKLLFHALWGMGENF
jgi:HTH-type transcriptional regulator, sugar sensing transcriptional regulator